MTKQELLSILHDWNFWKQDFNTGIQRVDYLLKLKDYLIGNQIITITGARRTGKSYIMRQMTEKLLSEGTPKKDILFVNFDDPRFASLNTELLDRIYETYLEYLQPGQLPYVFLDEIQEVDGWEKWVRMMHELRKVKIIVSGSNANLLSRELGTLLTGRHLDVTVFPLKFGEFLQFNDINIDDELDKIANRTKINSLLRSYLEYGAFPEVVLSLQKKEILFNYFDDLIHKDIVRRFRIRKQEALKALIKYYFSNISSLSTYNSIHQFLNISIDTIEKFTHYLEQVFLIFSLKRFSAKVKEQEKSPRKIYCIDTGLANALGFKLFENHGAILENLVFLELKKRQIHDPSLELFYWKDPEHREIDFVIRKGLIVTHLIQVFWDSSHEKTKEREMRSLRKGMRIFGIQKGIIITFDYADQMRTEEGTIVFMPIGEWLLS